MSNAHALNQQIVGEYTVAELSDIEVSCQKSDIKSITLAPTRTNSKCLSQVRIKSVAVSYDSGFNQFFEYPNENGREGSPFSRTSFNILPGTKCLSGLAINMIESPSSCSALDSKIQVVVNR